MPGFLWVPDKDLREPDGVTPARELWIHKDLEDEVRQLWESS